MAQAYIPEQAILDFNQQQLERGEADYGSDGELYEVNHRPAVRRFKGYIPEASYEDAVGDLTEAHAANSRAMQAYLEMQQQGIEVVNQDPALDPEYHYDLTGEGFQEDDDQGEYPADEADEEGEDYEEEDYDIWEDVVAGDPSTYPDPEDVLDQLKDVSEYFQPNPDEMRKFREIADYAESQGDYEYTAVARACQKANAGVWTVAKAYNEVVNDIGVEEALRIWVDLEANGVISFN